VKSKFTLVSEGRDVSLVINVTYDSSVSGAPAGFKTAVQAAVSFFEQTFTNNVTLNITFGWAALGGGAAAENNFYADTYTYSQMKSLLTVRAKSPDDMTAYATLPTSDPTPGGNSTWALTVGQEKALGISASAPYDDYVQLNSSLAWTFDPNNRAVPGEYDAIGAIEHEISEGAFGRIGDLNLDGFYTPLDLFRYSLPGVRNFSLGADTWFSIDGTHLLQEFNNHNQFGGDVADWYPTIQGDSFGDAYSGVVGAVTPTDLKELDILGWNLATSVVTVAQAIANYNANSSVAAMTIQDTAPDVVTNLDALETLAFAGAITSIALTGTGTQTLAITATQYFNDQAVLATIITPYSLTVSAAIVLDAPTLQSSSQVSSFTVADNASNIANAVTALNADTKLTSVSVTDTASQVATHLDHLNAITNLGSITLLGNAVLSVSFSQITTDAFALDKIARSHSVVATGITGQWFTTVEYDYGASGQLQTQEYTAEPSLWFTVLQDFYTSGVIAEQKFTGVTGQYYSAVENDYSTSGLLQTQEYTAVSGQWFTLLQDIYDTSGQIVEQHFNAVTGQWFSEVENDFNRSGQLLTQEYTAAPGQWYTALQNVYNASGQVTEQIFTVAPGQWDSSIENDYTPGTFNLLTQEYTATPGQWFTVLQYVYDSSGNVSYQNFRAINGSNTIIVQAANASVELTSAFSGSVIFNGSSQMLKLDNSSSFSGTVSGMSGADKIDFSDINFANVQPAQFSGTSTGGTLTVTDGTHTANIALLGNYLASTFVSSNDGHNGTSVVDPPALASSQSSFVSQLHHV